MSTGITMVMEVERTITEEEIVWDEGLSPTRNLSPMFAMALGFSLLDLQGVLGVIALPALEKASHVINAKILRERFDDLTPENGWGSHADAVEVIRKLIFAASLHPRARFKLRP